MHQRKDQINQSVEQILQAPIIESPIAEVLPTKQHVSTFNVGQNTIQLIPPTDIVADNTQLMFKIQ